MDDHVERLENQLEVWAARIGELAARLEKNDENDGRGDDDVN